MSNWRGKSIWSVSGRLMSAALAFLLNIVLARALSQDDLGQFFIGVSIAWGGALVCQWGASILAVKWIATARARGDRDAVRSAVWSLVGFTMLQGLAFSGLILCLQKPIAILLIWSAWTFAIGLQSLIPELLRGFDDLKWASLLSGPVPNLFSFSLLLGAWLIRKNLTYEQAAILMICSQLACSVFGLLLLNRRARFSLQLSSYRAFLHETTPIALSLAFTFLLGQADLWACNFLLRKEDVAIYGIAQKFCIFVSMPMMIFGSVVTPKLAELLALKNHVKMRELVGRGTYLTTVSAFAIFIAVAGVGWPVMGFFFGAKYTNSYPLFLVLGVGQVLHSIAGPNGYLLLLSGDQKSAMAATVFSALFLGGAAWLGGIYWGALGIALASTAALSLQSFLMWFEVKRKLSFSPHFNWREGRQVAKIRSES